MKKFLCTLLALSLAAGLGGCGAVKKLLPSNAPAQAGPASSAASSQQQQQPNSPSLGVRKRPQTDVDVAEALNYERSQNPDTVAWLRIPDTDVNDSVLQGMDNVEYLRRTERKKEDVYGCYFADYTNSIGPRTRLSPNTVIYGHSDLKDNPDGPRFSQLFKFTDPEFAASHPYIELTVLGETMQWEIFAVFYPHVSLDYIKTNLSGDELTALAQEAVNQSIYDYGVTVRPDDKILTLSTCTIKYGEGDTQHRFVVMGRLLPKDSPLAEQVTIKQKDGAQAAVSAPGPQTEG